MGHSSATWKKKTRKKSGMWKKIKERENFQELEKFLLQQINPLSINEILEKFHKITSRTTLNKHLDMIKRKYGDCFKEIPSEYVTYLLRPTEMIKYDRTNYLVFQYLSGEKYLIGKIESKDDFNIWEWYQHQFEVTKGGNIPLPKVLNFDVILQLAVSTMVKSLYEMKQILQKDPNFYIYRDFFTGLDRAKQEIENRGMTLSELIIQKFPKAEMSKEI